MRALPNRLSLLDIGVKRESANPPEVTRFVRPSRVGVLGKGGGSGGGEEAWQSLDEKDEYRGNIPAAATRG